MRLPTAEATVLDIELLGRINAARANPVAEATRLGIDLNQGLAPGSISPEAKAALVISPQLQAAADAHSLDMLGHDLFSHSGSDGSSPAERMTEAGFAFTPAWRTGENIAAIWGAETTLGSGAAAQLEDNLFRSPEHRLNLLNPEFHELGVALEGGEYLGSPAVMLTQDFASASAVVVTASPAPHAPLATSLGTGSDVLVFQVSQDSWQGDTQYSITVDGYAATGILTASALHGSGQDTLTLRGDWMAGPHTVAVSFLNDGYGGTPAADRNLYIEGFSYDGAVSDRAPVALLSPASASFLVQDATSVGTGATSIGSGLDVIVLQVSQDRYGGDAQYTISVDGQKIAGVLTARAISGSGVSDTVSVHGDWQPGPHSLVVDFVNDLYGGSGLDRNLHVDAITMNGRDGHAETVLYRGGPEEFSLLNPGRAPLSAQLVTASTADAEGGSDWRSLLDKADTDAVHGMTG